MKFIMFIYFLYVIKINAAYENDLLIIQIQVENILAMLFYLFNIIGNCFIHSLIDNQFQFVCLKTLTHCA